jgi:hypothetical protein
MVWRRVAGWSLLSAPVGQIGGWALMRLGGNEGVEPQTTIAHTVWLAGFVFLGLACVELYRRVDTSGAAQVVARVSVGVALFSVAASIGEMCVDLYVAASTDTHTQEDALYAQILAYPGVEQLLFGFGTQLVYLGVLVLVVQLTVLKRVGTSVLVFVLASLVLFVVYELVLDGNGFARQSLMPAAVLCMWLALAPLGRRMLKPAPALVAA